jgi:hypothetical protein
MQEETDIGPLATGRQLRDIEAQVQAAIKAGGRLLTGGHQLGRVGNYYEPTVITGVPRTAGIFREEVFGPVAMLFRVRDVDEAIKVANDTPFGLGASVWTRDPEEERTFVERLECGGVFVNAMVASEPRAFRSRHARVPECEDGSSLGGTEKAGRASPARAGGYGIRTCRSVSHRRGEYSAASGHDDSVSRPKALVYRQTKEREPGGGAL